MPYSKTTLAQTGNALSLEMKGLLDTALTAVPVWSRVTTGYVSGTKTFDVWLNDGTTDGYPWYLIVATDTAATGRVYLSGCLEYSDFKKTARKAFRGQQGPGANWSYSADGMSLMWNAGVPNPTNNFFYIAGGTTSFPVATTGVRVVSSGTSNSAFTLEASEPGGYYRSGWCAYLPAESGSATFDTIGQAGNSVLQIYTSSVWPPTLASLVLVAEDIAGSAGSGRSTVTTNVTAGTQYYVRVSSLTNVAITVNLGITGPKTDQEIDWPLSSFATGASVQTSGSLGAYSPPAAAVTGNIMRVLVTGQSAWVWWGTTTTGTNCHGVSTYQNTHSTTQDLKPLAFIGHTDTSTYKGGSVWVYPAVNMSTTCGNCTYSNTMAGLTSTDECFSMPAGRIGGGGWYDLTQDSKYVGSRLHVVRDSGGSSSGGPTTAGTIGWSLGIAPADFLIFYKTASVVNGDTITVDGKVYESIANAGAVYGLFVNTQPSV